MFFYIFLVITIIVFLIAFSTIKIEIKDLIISFPKTNDGYTNNNYEISINLYVLKKVKIIKAMIIKGEDETEKVSKHLNNLKRNLIQDKKGFNENPFEVIKRLKVEIEKFKLNIDLGTEDAAITAIIVGTVASVLGILLKNKMEDEENIKYIVNPIYYNKNILQIHFQGIFKIKKIHIINTIIYIMKKRRVVKNGRTSNRRSYAYSNE